MAKGNREWVRPQFTSCNLGQFERTLFALHMRGKQEDKKRKKWWERARKRAHLFPLLTKLWMSKTCEDGFSLSNSTNYMSSLPLSLSLAAFSWKLSSPCICFPSSSFSFDSLHEKKSLNSSITLGFPLLVVTKDSVALIHFCTKIETSSPLWDGIFVSNNKIFRCARES